MTHVRIWQFRPHPARVAEFTTAYGPDGDWARLFSRGAGYLGTELLAPASPGGAYLTVDRWRSEADWEAFRSTHAADYRALDERLAGLCAFEAELGSFLIP